jgi:cell division protein FtsA
MSNENKRYAALEITSKCVRLVYGFVQDEKVYVLHALESSCNALEKGAVVESDALIAAIKGVVSSASESLGGIKIRDVVMAIPSLSLDWKLENASTNTIDPLGKIGQMDINNCISQLKKVKFQEGYKVYDVIPYKYVLDGKENSSESPLGKTAQNLTMYATVYALNEAYVDKFVKVVEQTGLKVKQVTTAPLATSIYLENVDDIQSLSKTYYLLNIGGDITTFSKIEDRSIITKNQCIGFGSDKISQYMSEKLNITFKEATMLKEKYGMDKEPGFKVYVHNNITFSDIDLAIKECLKLLIEKIKQVITNWKESDNKFIPIVLTGGGSRLNGLKELLESELGGNIISYVPYSFGARNQSYQVCLGLIKYADRYVTFDGDDSFTNTIISRVSDPSTNKKSERYDAQEEL